MTRVRDERAEAAELAASHPGDLLLRATSADDLDDRLDALTGSFEAWLPTSDPPIDASAGRSAEERSLIDAWVDARRQVARLERDSGVTYGPGALPANPDLPVELERLIDQGLRAIGCHLALELARSEDRPVPAWLADALAHRLAAGARQHLRLLASLPGVTVDEAVIPEAERLDLAAIEDRHRRARAESQRSYERAQARILPGE